MFRQDLLDHVGPLDERHTIPVEAVFVSYFIKVGPTNGYLVPFRSIEGRKQEFVDFCKRNLPPKKTKGLKA